MGQRGFLISIMIGGNTMGSIFKRLLVLFAISTMGAFSAAQATSYSYTFFDVTGSLNTEAYEINNF
jgi:hypothetical protein